MAFFAPGRQCCRYIYWHQHLERAHLDQERLRDIGLVDDFRETIAGDYTPYEKVNKSKASHSQEHRTNYYQRQSTSKTNCFSNIAKAFCLVTQLCDIG
jgi:hypothetical protein